MSLPLAPASSPEAEWRAFATQRRRRARTYSDDECVASDDCAAPIASTPRKRPRSPTTVQDVDGVCPPSPQSQIADLLRNKDFVAKVRFDLEHADGHDVHSLPSASQWAEATAAVSHHFLQDKAACQRFVEGLDIAAVSHYAASTPKRCDDASIDIVTATAVDSVKESPASLKAACGADEDDEIDIIDIVEVLSDEDDSDSSSSGHDSDTSAGDAYVLPKERPVVLAPRSPPITKEKGRMVPEVDVKAKPKPTFADMMNGDMTSVFGSLIDPTATTRGEEIQAVVAPFAIKARAMSAVRPAHLASSQALQRCA